MSPRDPLDRARVSHPCTKEWEALLQVAGDDARRYCGDCAKHVTDVSKLTRRQAMALLKRRRKERLCLLLQIDAGGRVLTRTGPAWWRRVAAAMAALLPFTALTGCSDEVHPTASSESQADDAKPVEKHDDAAPASDDHELTPEVLGLLRQLGGYGYHSHP